MQVLDFVPMPGQTQNHMLQKEATLIWCMENPVFSRPCIPAI